MSLITLDVFSAVELIQHFNLTRDTTHRLRGDVNGHASPCSSYMLGYMGAYLFEAIQDAGGLLGEW